MRIIHRHRDAEKDGDIQGVAPPTPMTNDIVLRQEKIISNG
jgi:hypothetical protein